MTEGGRRSEAEFRRIVERVKPRMMAAAYRLTRDPDDAADAIQDALFKIWTRLDRILAHPNPEGYMLSVCATSACDLLRKRAVRAGRETALDEELTGFSEPAGPETVRERDTVRLVQGCLATMPKSQSRAVFLRIFEEAPFESIAKALSCSEVTARSHVSKGLARLRALLAERDISFAEKQS